MKQTVLRKAIGTIAQLREFFPALLRSGLLANEGGFSSLVSLLPTQLRYRFTTARELEHGYHSVPDRIALIDDDGQLTYRELRNQARILAGYLRDLQLPELHLGIMARNGRGIILPQGAKGYLGATSYLLNIGSSAAQLKGIIARDGINVLIIDEEFLPRVDADLDIPIIIAHRTSATTTINGYPSIDGILASHKAGKMPLLPKHGPMVVMSSGTTGVPKGVVRKEPILPTILASILTKVPWKAGMTVQITASMFHAWGWACFNIALGMRGTIVTRRVFNPEQVLADTAQHRCDAMISSPIFLKQLITVPNGEQYDCSNLKFIFSSGNALTPWLIEAMHARFGKILCNLYGSTEISGVAVASPEDIVTRPASSGTICAGTDIVILDDNDLPCPTGTPGRIFCWNSVTLRGYTDPKIPMSTYGHMIQIGDRGYLDHDGYLYVLGRADDMIIVGGENVYPRSVEEVLESMPGIQDLYAAGVSDEQWFKRIAVWIVRDQTDAGQALTEDSIRDWVSFKLAEHSVPRDVYFVDTLPRNATGKVIPAELHPPIS